MITISLCHQHMPLIHLVEPPAGKVLCHCLDIPKQLLNESDILVCLALGDLEQVDILLYDILGRFVRVLQPKCI